jgi:hypothetical protein
LQPAAAALQPAAAALQPFFQQPMGVSYATGLANFVEGAMGIRERLPSYLDIQDQLVVPNRLKNLGGAAARFEDLIDKFSLSGKKEFVMQGLPRRASDLQHVRTILRFQAEKQRADIVSKIKPEIMHKRSDWEGRSRTDTTFALDYNDTGDSDSMELPFNGELVADDEDDVPNLLNDKDTIGLRVGLEDKIESVLSRELLKYSGGSSYPEASKGLFSQLNNNLPENEDEKNELRILKRMLEQILNDQLRNYYGLQI